VVVEVQVVQVQVVEEAEVVDIEHQLKKQLKEKQLQ
tara:strand:+ start:48 stop:155 length:108 start_codon:yes stop_codon:yes gene_type:complete